MPANDTEDLELPPLELTKNDSSFQEIWDRLTDNGKRTAQLLSFFHLPEGIDNTTIQRIARWYNQGHSQDPIDVGVGLDELKKQNILASETHYKKAVTFAETEQKPGDQLNTREAEISANRQSAATTVKDKYKENPGPENPKGMEEFEGWNTAALRLVNNNFREFVLAQPPIPEKVS